ncbi:MAG: serine/threonine protein kinase, partial [Planctomycetes bacterium]|nr:serine/threonine protein kinase [Planctomycetota bacterium]
MIRENFDIAYYRSSLSKALPDCSIQAQLEQGGQGIVFHAWHRVAKRDLAVKVLAGGAFASLHSARRFRREVEIMSKMHHPNIVQTYDCGVFDGGLWYTMKFIEGIEVSGWQVIERPSERKCVELFIKVCDALAYAHRAGYIHRDIKPNNIHVDADDNPFILDFGLARPLPSEKRDDISAADHPVGTLNYMSPEQVIGEELLGVQTDIYSLGVVMYEVLSGGQMPYTMDGEVIERRRHIIETEPTPIKVFNPKIDQDLSSIVCKCLEKHPADRYDSMDALQTDLRNWLAGDAVTARVGNRWYRWKKTARRHKWPLIA